MLSKAVRNSARWSQPLRHSVSRSPNASRKPASSIRRFSSAGYHATTSKRQPSITLNSLENSWLGFSRRSLHSSTVLNHGGINRPEPGTGIKLHFQDSKGNPIKTVEANEGDDILAIAHEYDIDLEGACEGSVACSTCHVILPEEQYDLLPEPDDDENDMLDMAFGLTDTSRLGCQVKITKELDGMTITLPSATRNMFVDGHTPTRH